MAGVKFGQIPFKLICRFGELTKTEIVIVSYLYACRNEATRQCNPSRKTISGDTGIFKTHLSTAIKMLEERGWILEDENGNYTLFQNPPVREKVTKTVTGRVEKVTKTVTGRSEAENPVIVRAKVTETVTGVTNSVTRVTNIVTGVTNHVTGVTNHVTGDNKVPEQRKNKEAGTEKGTAESFVPPPQQQRFDGKTKPPDLTVEQKREFNAAMDFLKSRIDKFPDYAAQGKALKWMLQNGANLVQIKKGLERQIAEYEGRWRASFLTLQKDIFRWIREGNGQILEVKRNGSNQKDGRRYAAKQTPADTYASYGYYDNA